MPGSQAGSQRLGQPASSFHAYSLLSWVARARKAAAGWGFSSQGNEFCSVICMFNLPVLLLFSNRCRQSHLRRNFHAAEQGWDSGEINNCEVCLSCVPIGLFEKEYSEQLRYNSALSVALACICISHTTQVSFSYLSSTLRQTH